MKQSVYIETTIISYLAARPSRDLIVAAHQQLTHEWWEHRASRFDLFISQLVIVEARRGDPDAVERRMDFMSHLPLLRVETEVVELGERLLGRHAVPKKAADDALHIAIAAINGVDYLLTWNCKHIANAETHGIIVDVLAEQGYNCPQICTPEELMGG